MTTPGAGELLAKTKTQGEARKVLDDAQIRAYKTCKEVKKQADIVYKEAKKLAIEKPAKEAADKAHKEAVKQADKVRDAILAEAMSVFTATYTKGDTDYAEAIAKSKERIDRAEKAYEEAKKQADIVYKEAKKLAVEKPAKEAADKAHKEALKQAKQEYDERINRRDIRILP